MRSIFSNRRKSILILIISVILLFLVYKIVRLGPILFQIKTSSGNLLALRGASTDALLQPGTLNGAANDLGELNASLADLQKATRTELWLLSHLGWFPGIGGDLAALPVLLDAGIESTAAGSAAANAALPFAALREQRPLAAWAMEQDPQIDAAWDQAQPDLNRAAVHFKNALDAIDVLDTMPGSRRLDPYLDRYLDRVRPALPLARIGIEMIKNEPAVVEALLGLTRSRRYLIILQNPWEIRPTGGFISAVVVCTVSGGSFELGAFTDSWNIDANPEQLPGPPLSLNQAMWGGKINFLNSNWSADMPTSAGWAIKLYEIGQGVKVDGVLAFDPYVLQSLLQVTGPVHIAGFQTEITADNLWEQLISFHDNPQGVAEDATTGEILARRKDFLPVVAGPLMERLQSGIRDPQTMVGMAQALMQALQERHLLITSQEPEVAAWLNSQGWDGAIWQGPGDYIQVVDANVGFNKTNARVERTVDYQVDLNPDGSATAVVDITYQNSSQLEMQEPCFQELPEGAAAEGWIDDCYWTYTRLYAPAGSELISASPDRWPPNSIWEQMNPTAKDPGVQVGPPEAGRQVFGTMVLVPPQSSATVHFEYKIPPGVWNAADGYRLYLQKQSGTINTIHHVSVQLAEGETVLETDGKVVESGVMADFSLLTDETLEIKLGGEVVEGLALAPSVTPTVPIATPEPTATFTPIPTFTPGPTPTPVVLLITATPSPTPIISDTTQTITMETPEGERLTWSRIQIPAIGTDSTIVKVGWQLVGPAGARRAEWEVAAYAAGHHKDSAYPGEVGNVVLSGHHNILGEVFRNLWDLKPGDDIYLMDNQNTIYHYVTRGVHIFPEATASEEERAAHLKYLERKPEAILTLVTCWPYESNTHRTIVVADLVNTETNNEAP